MAWSISAQAETMEYQCGYTKSSYTAPFSGNKAGRQCPEGRCGYAVIINGQSARINNVAGYTVEQTEKVITLKRTVKDPVMGGMDSTVFTIDKENKQFKSVKTTTPSVTLVTQGQCL